MHKEKALPIGSILKGGKYEVTITELLTADSQGFLYIGEIKDNKSCKGSGNNTKVVVREHFMTFCSERAADGCTVETPEDIAPTVEGCLENFKLASELRREVAFNYPTIIDVLDCFAYNNTYYYLVEYLNGATFEEYINQNGPITLDEARVLLRPIFRAAAHFHVKRALHSDIHPRHIRFTTHHGVTEPVLFSLYTSIHFNEDGRRLWSIQNTNCREGYAPPEQYFEIENFLPQIDVYALAATLVFALSGKHLPDSRTISEEIIRETLPKTLAETYVSALIHALSPDYTTRTVSVTGFFDKMKLTYDIRQQQLRHHSAEPTPDLPAPRNDGLRMKLMAVGAILAAVAAILALIFTVF
ncbi:MAG: hypothetical protein NC339_00355 [Muribaculaceae bacterium]|nr:hypothetical protein [Muribaculaceae bacterium]